MNKINDLISRQAAIDAICKEGTRLERNGTVAMCEIKQWCIDLLERLPSAQPEPQWIPCSERLPEVYKDVLICWDFKGNREVLIGNMYSDGTFHGYDGAIKRVTCAKYQKRLKRWELTGARAYWRVLAWMPLPEPYREERTEE